MKALLAVVFALVLCATTTQAQTTAQKNTQPKSVKPIPLSDGFIRPATRAFTTIKESANLLSSNGPTPADDRISEADAAASTPADKGLVAAIKDYKMQKAGFNVLYKIKRVTAELDAKIGGEGVPAWSCAPLEDEDVCPSFQAAVKSLLARDRDLANKQAAMEDCEDSIAGALKTKAFDSAPACGSKGKAESK